MKKLIFFLSRIVSRKKVAAIVIILLLTGIGGFIYHSKKQQPAETVIVKKSDLKSTVSASGVLDGKNNANLKFKSSGKLVYMGVKSGDQVSAGQLLANLDTRDLSIALQQAKNNLRDKQALVDKTVDDIHLFQYGNGGFSNVGTSSETQTQRSTRTTSEVARDNAVDSMKAAQLTFDSAIITSPFDGLVITADFLPGQVVTTTDTIVKLVDWSVIYFDADIDESDLGKVLLNQKAEVTLNSYGDRVFNGTVEQILPQSKTTSTGSTVVTVRINLGNPSINLIAGLNGQATIINAEAKNVLVIPQESVKDNNTIQLQTDKGIKTVEIKTGLSSDTNIEVKEGLEEGDEIIKNPK